MVVKAPAVEDGQTEHDPYQPSGLFLSLGVDSLCSLATNLRDHRDDDESLSYLIHVHGFDMLVRAEPDGVLPAIRANGRKVADAVGKSFVPVTTNLRNLMDRYVDWSLLGHGAGLASVGLALEGLLGKVRIAAGLPNGSQTPCGSHPSLDPLWSTERLSVIYDGGEVDRDERVARVARFPLALETLRICYQDPPPAYNCGRCWKCLSTMIRLEIAGALERCATLPHPLDLEAVRSAEVEPTYTASSVQHLAKQVHAWGGNPGLEAVLEARAAEMLARRPSSVAEIEYL